jgi:hypothetical protein
MNDEKVLSEKETLQMSHALQNDRVEPLKPLVDTYGWVELFERFENSVEKV